MSKRLTRVRLGYHCVDCESAPRVGSLPHKSRFGQDCKDALFFHAACRRCLCLGTGDTLTALQGNRRVTCHRNVRISYQIGPVVTTVVAQEYCTSIVLCDHSSFGAVQHAYTHAVDSFCSRVPYASHGGRLPSILACVESKLDDQ